MSKNQFEEVLYFYNNEVMLVYDDSLHAYYEAVDGVKYEVTGVTTAVGIIDKSAPLTQWAANMTIQYIRENLGSINKTDALGSHVFIPEEFEALLEKARFNFRTIKKAAADIGTIAHDWLQNYVNQVLEGNPLQAFLMPVLPEDEKASSCVQAAMKWMEIHNFQPTASEQKIFSREFGYAGTFDWTGYVTSCGDPTCCPFTGTVFALGDYKSSRDLYDEYRAQTAAYQYAYNEELRYTDPTKPEVEARVLLLLGKESGDFKAKVLMPSEFERDMEGYLGALQVYNWLRQFSLDKKATKQEARAAKAAEKAAKPKRKPRRLVAPPDELIPVAS